MYLMMLLSKKNKNDLATVFVYLSQHSVWNWKQRYFLKKDKTECQTLWDILCFFKENKRHFVCIYKNLTPAVQKYCVGEISFFFHWKNAPPFDSKFPLEQQPNSGVNESFVVLYLRVRCQIFLKSKHKLFATS